ncbi:MAG: DUF4038 domain-containing protein [Candidatus Zixiibacteriota bacterium]
MRATWSGLLIPVLTAILFAASSFGADYSESTAGAVQQPVGCDGCGAQILRANYYVSEITPVNSGMLDSAKIRISNNYGGSTRCFGIVYGDQSNGIGAYLGRSRDSASSSMNTMADRVLHFNSGINLTAGSTYYIGIFTDSTNTTSMRFAITNSSAGRSGITGFDPPHVIVPNYTTAGLAQWENQGVSQIYVTYFYHSGGVVTAPAIPTPASPFNGASGQTTAPTLIWNASSGATSYRLQVSTNSGFTAVVLDQAAIGGTSFTAPGLQYSTTYYWRVLATNSGGSSAYSSSWTFVTQALSSGSMNSLVVSANRRYLQAGGTPVFLNGEAAWSLVVQPTYAGADQYLTDRAGRGVNLVMVNLIEKMFGDRAPGNIANISPWTGSTFATPNEPYFAHVDSVVIRAQQLGIYVMLFPVYLGYAFAGGVPAGHSAYEDGWHNEIAAASSATMKNWGIYVGNRYRNYPNVLWGIGGDSDPSSVRAKLDTFVAGLQSADNVYAGRIITGHGGSPLVASSQFPESWLNLNNTYSWTLSDYLTLADQAYAVSPTKPFILLEGVYENNTQISWTYQQLRAQTYWTLLRGGCGHFFGNNPIWYFSATAAGSPTYPWQNDLNSTLTQQITYLNSLWKSIHWWTLVPDRAGAVITSGANSGTNLATFAVASDSTVIVGYLPSSRTVTINPSGLKGDSVIVRWLNPSSGTFSAAGTQTKVTRSYTPPSSGDWVLSIAGNMTTVVVQAPGAPSLTSPVSGSTGIPINPTLTWAASPGATSYRVQVSTDVSFVSPVIDQSSISTTSVNISGLTGGATYYWRVNASNTAGPSPYSAVWNFATAVGLPPSVPTLASPLNGATGLSTGPTVSWNTSSGATGYRVQVSADPAFATVLVDQSNVTTTSLALSGLQAATSYNWRVSASNGNGPSAFSSTWSFVTASGASTAYVGTTVGTVQQAVGCSGCGTQIQKANYYISQVSPANSGTLDSIKIRMSNNYGGAVGCFGVIYGDQATGIGNYLGRSRDSVKSTVPTMADYTLRFNAGISLAAGSRYYVGVISNQSNTTTIRLAVTSNTANRTGVTGFDPPHVVVANYTSAGLSQYQNQGVKQLYLTYYYHSGGVASSMDESDVLARQATGFESEGIPDKFSLSQNYPNPFNPTTTIEFSLQASGNVTLDVFNLLGQRIRTLADGVMEAGTHRVEWNSRDDHGSTVSSGVYFYRLTAGEFVESKKMMLLK